MQEGRYFLHTSPADKEDSGRQGWQVVGRVQGALVDPHRQIFLEDVRAVTNPWFSLSQVATNKGSLCLGLRQSEECPGLKVNSRPEFALFNIQGIFSLIQKGQV